MRVIKGILVIHEWPILFSLMKCEMAFFFFSQIMISLEAINCDFPKYSVTLDVKCERTNLFFLGY